jgi:hypothetical protein
MFGSRKPSTRKAQPPNPNPGAWDTKQADRRRQTVEVDRILAKVSREGIQSLSYVEQQTLESASRQRREEEREFDRQTRL